ncbi:flagellar protein FlaG [Pseudoalteromonas ruthenica]|uniref:flagellar protein FlaG n=1 Tax=Pseudoalteromonas ruthenica TaxID=151081 RepID=UPI00110AF4D9|nr:flagellar protein FlaG [Pseudoalteromonas ruthenica]TMO43802.1 flagellar biosynthesis protein FlaG [Pseudoalteromonas ruthenica]TMO51729.1 flagellar biosynthesis protein FlaG [Pseudoalteromonas ruthenica]
MAEINLNQDLATVLQSSSTASKKDSLSEAKNEAKLDVQEDIKLKAEDDSLVSNKSELMQTQQQLNEELRESLDRINDFIPIRSTNLVFEFDELGDPPIVKVIDRDSEEVIREIPPKEFREVAKALEEFADKLDNRGVFFDQSA